MDKYSPKISIKLNGTNLSYKEKRTAIVSAKKDEALIYSSKVEPHIDITPASAKQANIKKRIALTISSAVILGTGLGIAVLQTLGDSQTQGKQPNAIVSNQQQTVQHDTIALQPVTLSILQTGVFSSKEKGQATLDAMKAKGIPVAIREETGKYYLVTFVSNDGTSAKQMGDLLSKKNISFYVKEWSIPQTTVPKQYNATLIAKSESILLNIVKQSTQLYVTGSMDEAKWSQMNKERESITKEGSTIQQEDVKQLMTSLSASSDALNDYKTKKTEESFMKLQQTVVDGLTIYEKIVTAK
ncbi:hypothetical protein [Ectobacillus sp. sgz5001026]|uniref:hypothetical protein n=1 Tax=Ectobacillus sp. sgz5001026 TaxID=3242473 RepID=UPI0036D2940B